MSPASAEDDEDSEARRLALEALSVGDAAEALRLCRFPSPGNGRAKPWVSAVQLCFYDFRSASSSVRPRSLSLSTLRSSRKTPRIPTPPTE